jgi:hypothetical protein
MDIALTQWFLYPIQLYFICLNNYLPDLSSEISGFLFQMSGSLGFLFQKVILTFDTPYIQTIPIVQLFVYIFYSPHLLVFSFTVLTIWINTNWIMLPIPCRMFSISSSLSSSQITFNLLQKLQSIYLHNHTFHHINNFFVGQANLQMLRSLLLYLNYLSLSSMCLQVSLIQMILV